MVFDFQLEVVNYRFPIRIDRPLLCPAHRRVAWLLPEHQAYRAPWADVLGVGLQTPVTVFLLPIGRKAPPRSHRGPLGAGTPERLWREGLHQETDASGERGAARAPRVLPSTAPSPGVPSPPPRPCFPQPWWPMAPPRQRAFVLRAPETLPWFPLAKFL